MRRAGLLHSSVRTLRDFGFRWSYAQPDDSPLEDLVAEAALEVLTRSGANVQTVLLYSALDSLSASDRPRRNRTLRAFRYPVAGLAERLGLSRANALALSQQGCSGLLSAIHIAGQMACTSGDGPVLCLAADSLPAGDTREIMYNVMSDAASAAVVDAASPRNRIVSFHQRSEAAYWDTPALQPELVAAYFPMAQRTIIEALERTGLGVDAIRWFVPSNVSLRSWTILADLIKVPLDHVWTENIARIGHTVSSDHLINLVDMEKAGALTPGDLLLLFTFGFGASWSVMILRH